MVVAGYRRGHRALRGHYRLTQPNLKRVLAYSTISQFGYMFLAVGVGATRGHVPSDDARLLQGAPLPGAGSVMHALAGE